LSGCSPGELGVLCDHGALFCRRHMQEAPCVITEKRVGLSPWALDVRVDPPWEAGVESAVEEERFVGGSGTEGAWCSGLGFFLWHRRLNMVFLLEGGRWARTKGVLRSGGRSWRGW